MLKKKTPKPLLIERNRNICNVGSYDEKHIFLVLDNFKVCFISN